MGDGASKQLDQNIELIRRYLQSAKDNKRPAALLMGAGASVSAGIPLADGFVEIISKKFPYCLPDASEEQRQSYQYCMGQLSLQDRKDVIETALAKARLNWGHIALAQLIKEGYFSRILTFNFDQLLEQSLSLLGQLTPVYDFGTAPSEETEYIAEPAIIHLQGQGYGFKLIHDLEETKKHAEKLRPIFQDTLQSRDMLVIGYSGSADPYLNLLKQQFRGGHNLLWLNYSESSGHELDDLGKRNQTRVFNSCDFDQTMIGLAKKLGTWPPEFVNNPLRHIQSEIAEISDYPPQEGNSDEIDILGFLRSRLDEEIPIWDQNSQPQQIISEAFHHPNDSKAIEKLGSLLEDRTLKLTDDMKEMAAWAFVLHGGALTNQAYSQTGDAANTLFDHAYEQYQAALEIKPDFHEALNNWGGGLYHQAQSHEGAAADALYKQAGGKCQAALEIKSDFYDALSNWGNALFHQAKTKKGATADALYQQAREKCQAALEIKPDLHQALNNWGSALFHQAKTKEGAAADGLFERAYAKYQAALKSNPNFHEAINNWGNALFHQANAKEGAVADALFEHAYEKYQAAIEIKTDKHKILSNWGNALFHQAYTKEGAVADALFEHAYEKYQAALEIKPYMHEVLYNWGHALSLQARTKTGKTVDTLLQEAIKKYRTAFNIKPDKHEVLNNWGEALLILARTKTGDAADDLFDQAGEIYQRAGDIGLYNLACLAALRGQNRKAISLLKKSLAAGKLPKKPHLEQDSDLDGLRRLKSFQTFMAQLPD